MRKVKQKIKTGKKEKSVDYMHSSCIVVRLDWAAGLPAWLIRSFGSPDLTRKTLFSSQKHQSHGSWDLNEDSWLTPCMNIYQFLDIARRYTLECMHHSHWQSLARLCYQCHFVFFFTRNTVWQVHTLNVTVMLGSSSHAGWKNSFSVSYRFNWRLSVWLTANGIAVWTSACI